MKFCAAKGCTQRIPLGAFMCSFHYYHVPFPVRMRLHVASRRISQATSDIGQAQLAYTQVLNEAIQSVKEAKV